MVTDRGPGSRMCQLQAAGGSNAREAVAMAGVEAEVVKVIDYREIVARGVMSTPGPGHRRQGRQHGPRPVGRRHRRVALHRLIWVGPGGALPRAAIPGPIADGALTGGYRTTTMQRPDPMDVSRTAAASPSVADGGIAPVGTSRPDSGVTSATAGNGCTHRSDPAPFRGFAQSSASSGLLLMAAAVFAMVMANSPWSESWTALWETKLTFSLGSWSFSLSLLHWINDGPHGHLLPGGRPRDQARGPRRRGWHPFDAPRCPSWLPQAERSCPRSST